MCCCGVEGLQLQQAVQVRAVLDGAAAGQALQLQQVVACCKWRAVLSG